MRSFLPGGRALLQPETQALMGATSGEFEWGGIGDTHGWVPLRLGIARLAMTQRQHGFWHIFSFEFKRHAYAALGH